MKSAQHTIDYRMKKTTAIWILAWLHIIEAILMIVVLSGVLILVIRMIADNGRSLP